MENNMISVPLSDFVDGVKAQADLDSLRSLVSSCMEYCPDTIKAILGLPIKDKE